MRLLYIVKSITKGGVTSVLINRLNYLAENTDFEIFVLSEFENNPKSIALFSKKIVFKVLDIKGIVSKKRLPLLGRRSLIKSIAKKYSEAIDIINPDIITDFDWGFYTDIIPFLHTRAIKIKEVHVSYLGSKLLKKTWYAKYVERNQYKNHNYYDFLVALTQSDLNDRTYLKIDSKAIFNPSRIPSDITPFQGRSNIILGVGVLTDQKNFSDLLKAVKLIKDKLYDWEIHIYGEGHLKSALQEEIEFLNIENIVFLKGHTYNINDVYNDAKILVSPSIYEGFGLNILEALTFKIPVISYDFKCGAREIIGDTNGSIIELGDVQRLSEELLLYISNSKLLEDKSENIDIRKFDNLSIMNEWINLYKTFKPKNEN